MAKTEHRQRSLALYETILKLKDLDECCKFFDDLCTPTELRSMEQRFDVAVYLQQGLVYLDILDKTGASSATISRVRRSMLDNGAGGVMETVIRREGLGHTTDSTQHQQIARHSPQAAHYETTDVGQRRRCPGAV